MRTVKARISWLTPELNGRQHPPITPIYSTVARFAKDKESKWDSAWSVVLDLNGVNNQSLSIVTDLRFLVPEAPSELLQPGEKLELYEGEKKVADVEVLG